MSRLVLTQITIKKERSISSTTWYYLLQPANASAPDSTNYGNPPPTYSDTGYSGWSTTEPTYTVGDNRVLYVMVQTLYSDGTFSYSTPTISSSYEAAKDAYNEVIQAEATISEFEELGLKRGYVWDNMTYVAPSGSIPAYPIGTYVASGMLVNGQRSITRSNSNTYGLNTWISTGGINLRYNAIDLMKLTTSNLEFYYPSTSSQQKKAISLGTNGAVNSLAFYGFNSDKKTMELTNDGLHFYNPSNGTTELASFTTNGLILKKGGIEAGTKNTTDYIYIYSNDDATNHKLIINNHEASDWRIIAGNKFGVDKAGNLYASSANITGAIVATSLDLITNNVKIGTGSINGLASVATTGSYNDLSNKPTIPSLTGYIYENGTVGNTPAEGATGFVVSSSGALQASNAIIYGSLYASAGYVGGWRIGTDGNKTLHNGNTDASPVPGEGVIILSKGIIDPPATGLLPANKTWAFTAGNNFGVTTDGILYTNGANITNINGQNITAKTITIGSFTEDTRSDILNDNVNVPTKVADLTDSDNYTLKTDFDELDNYVNSHMVLTENELSILSNNTTAKIILDLNGLSIYNTNKLIAQYGQDAIIGDKNGFHIEITANYESYFLTNDTSVNVEKTYYIKNNDIYEEVLNPSGNPHENNYYEKKLEPRLSFYRDNNYEVAYISENRLYITQSVVLDQMDIGRNTKELDFFGNPGKGQWSWKVHEVNNRNNLYLKWLG